jgi:serine/threonine-protein kinase
VFVKSGGASDYALTRGGALAYVTAEAGTPAPRALVWVDRKGREEPLDMPQRLYGAPRISPDGTSVAISILDNGSAEVWAFDLPGGPLKRLTFSPHTNGVGNWTPDGRQIVFSMYDENGVLNLYRVSATGTGRYEPIAPGSRHRWGSSVTRDGKGLFAFDQTPQGHNRVLLLPITSESQSQSPDKVLFEGNFSDVSPDGRYIAYQSVETGPSEVFVRAFPDVRNGPWQISTAGGAHPVWSRDGRELFFKDAANALNVVRVDTSGLTLVSGPPVKVFDTPYYEPNPQRWYDVSPDGRRFLMIKESTPPRSATPASMVVVQNWADELKARLSR